ncbi:MAG TPA: hypothetical protein PL082_06725, partial [Tepidiformaceae bacterium]|nr:hypothetical protein [Tepidiformaceae bacterium]
MNHPAPATRLALHGLHEAMGATFAETGRWTVPVRYGAAAAELDALRQRAAVFDRSDRSRFLVTGTDAAELLATVFAGHVAELEEGRSMRAVWLGEDGSIGDLALISRTAGIAYLVSGEPGQRESTYDRLRSAAEEDFDVRIDDRTETTCLVGLAGPDAAQVANDHLSDALPARLGPLHCIAFEFHGFRGLAVRASDTGEDGFEFMLAPAVAQHLIETLCGGEPSTVARVMRRVEAMTGQLDAFQLRPGIEDLLKRLKDQGLVLGAREPRWERLERAGIASFFVDDLAVAPTGCILVGDRLDADIIPAKGAG